MGVFNNDADQAQCDIIYNTLQAHFTPLQAVIIADDILREIAIFATGKIETCYGCRDTKIVILQHDAAAESKDYYFYEPNTELYYCKNCEPHVQKCCNDCEFKFYLPNCKYCPKCNIKQCEDCPNACYCYVTLYQCNNCEKMLCLDCETWAICMNKKFHGTDGYHICLDCSHPNSGVSRICYKCYTDEYRSCILCNKKFAVLFSGNPVLFSSARGSFSMLFQCLKEGGGHCTNYSETCNECSKNQSITNHYCAQHYHLNNCEPALKKRKC